MNGTIGEIEMLEFFRDFFSSRDAFARNVRAVAIAATVVTATPEIQAALAASIGPWAIVIPAALGLLSGRIAVGEKNPTG
jgi:hypothetical protein